MTDIKSLVSKKTRRAKAILLQNFVKTDKTTDEIFEVYHTNFNRQQATAQNLQKHVKHYLHCLKELHEASKGLSNCLLEIHEKEWPKHDVYENNAYELDHINEDLEEKIKESVLVPLEQYLGQFSEMREKIAKRGRKLVDYDSQRRDFETLQHSKQTDDPKFSKSRDQLEEARKVYDTLNQELHDELPALYDNRIPLIITVFQRLFSSEISYHDDSGVIKKSYLETVEQLSKATEKGYLEDTDQRKPKVKSAVASNIVSSTDSIHNSAFKTPNAVEPPASFVSKTSETTQQPVESSKQLLHKVRATYKYLAEDEDELSFEAGEIIQVIEYDDPQEQEEGWLMGIKESNGQKGLFPANFTKQI